MNGNKPDKQVDGGPLNISSSVLQLLTDIKAERPISFISCVAIYDGNVVIGSIPLSSNQSEIAMSESRFICNNYMYVFPSI